MAARSIKNSFRKIHSMRSRLSRSFLAALLLLPIGLQAGTGDGSSFNPVPYGLAAIVVVLMAAIAILAVVLKQLVYAYRDQFRRERSGGNTARTLLTVIMLGASAVAMAQGTAAEAPVQIASPYISGMLRGDFYLVTGVIFFELLLILVLLGMIYQMVRVLRNIPEKRSLVDRIMSVNLLDFFNKSVAVEKEHTIVLDHEYDGIHELDNSLPPWWKWGFVMTIVFAFAYMWYYHMADGPNQIDEYVAAVAKGEQEKAAYLEKAGNSVDENTVTLIADAGQLADAKVLYNNTCAACHREDGGGAVGPNLTDEYWLHGGSLKDVFKSVKYGWKDKGMPEWQHNMSASQLAGITSYIITLRGKNPVGAKAPQGELYEASGDGQSTDSTGATPASQIGMSVNDGAPEQGKAAL